MAVIEYDEFDDPMISITDPEKKRMLDFIYSSKNPDYGFDLLKKWRLML